MSTSVTAAVTALRDRLTEAAMHRFDVAEVVREIAEAFERCGLQPTRVSLAVLSLHPSLAGVGFTWRRTTGAVERLDRPYGFLSDPEHRASPLHAVMTSRSALRLRLHRGEGFDTFPVARDFAASGGTDYVALPLLSPRQDVHVFTMMTDSPDGWDDAELSALDDLLPTLALLIEVFEAHRLTTRERLDLLLRAQTDRLTGMLNRHGTLLEADNRFGGGRPALAIAIDLDGLKGINNRLGHRYGDAVIHGAATRIVAVLPADAVAGRTEGDEFLIVTDTGHDALAEVIRAMLAEPYEVDGLRLLVTASLGTAEGAERAEELARRADLAMLASKRAGRNRVTAFLPDTDARRQRAAQIARLLPEALARGELRIAIQPIVSVDDGRLMAGECLARWTSPELGVVRPDEFVPIAEQSGDIVLLDRYVLRSALRILSSRGTAPHVPLAVNLSALDAALTRVDDDVLAELAAHDVAPSLLTLELTESVFAGQSDVADQLRRVRAAGVSVSVDDFGTGYSSLSYLQRFEIDAIKVDRSIVSALPDPRASAIMASVLALGSALRLRVVAEGVESPEQHAALRALGCGLAQGYLFSRPLEVPAWMERLQASVG
ncbi:MAG: bifunctional diguanylate cyclase/phosphodiesterase [Myxococcales bacterium]|nr:bifunctional diguanylate cyclase/phosphodiesterase [Myxococcales bacterium]